jgi:beta-glucosidase
LLAGALGLAGLLASPSGAATAGVITISPPGTQNNYAGDVVDLKLTATDSAPGTTLTYSLNALPDGLALNHATGVVSGRVTVLPGTGGEGLSLTLTVTGSDGATAMQNFAWNVTNQYLQTPLGPVRSGYPGMCLDDQGNKTTAGNPIQLAKCDGSAGEWVTWTGNSLRILGKCVDDPGGTSKQGTPLRLATCTGGGSQNILKFGQELMFFPSEIGAGCVDAPHATAGTRLVLGTASCPLVTGKTPAGLTWTPPSTPLVLALDGKCLTDPSESSSFTGKAVVSSCDASPEQNLTLQPTNYTSGGLSEYQVIAQNILGCLTVHGGGTASGTKVDWEVCATGNSLPSSPSQLWIPKNGALVNAQSGKCLDDPGSSTANGVQPDISPCTGHPNQRWTPPPSPVASELPGTCLATTGTAPANASAVVVTKCATQQAPVPAQEWTFTGGTLRNQGKCLSVRGRGTATGTTVDIYPCTSGDTNQQWQVLPGDELKNTRSGKCLAFPAAVPAAGVNLVIKPCAVAFSAAEWWHII